jgi:hypothetical protein
VGKQNRKKRALGGNSEDADCVSGAACRAVVLPKGYWMKYYIIKPEVAGNWGDNIIVDVSVHPPIVKKLHYEFDSWLGDCIVESFPCYIITKDVQKQLIVSRMTGISFDDVEVSTSELFQEICPNCELPKFIWLKVHGIAGKDDFGITKIGDLWGMLVISENALDLLKKNTFLYAEITEYNENMVG